VSPQLRVVIWGIVIGESRTREDGAALYPRLQALLLQAQSLQFVQAIPLCSTIQQRVLKNNLACSRMPDGRLDGTASIVIRSSVFQLMTTRSFVVDQARVVVTLVEVLEQRGEDFGEFVCERDTFLGSQSIKVLGPTKGGKEGRDGEDGLVAGKEARFRADTDCYYRGGARTTTRLVL